MANTVKVQGSKTVARARKGDTGNGGITYRITVWEDRKEYRNDSSLKTDGERIIDVAVNKAMSLIGDTSFKAYKCRVTHTSDAQSRPLAVGTYWEAINTLQPIVTPVLLADKIAANFIDVDELTAKHVQVKVGSNVIADMGGDTSYPLFLGGATAALAKTKFSANGELYCAGGEFEGTVKANILYRKIGQFTLLTGGTLTLTKTSGDIIIIRAGGATGAASGVVLPSASEMEGRVIDLFCYMAANVGCFLYPKSGDSLVKIDGTSVSGIDLRYKHTQVYSDGTQWIRLIYTDNA